MPAIIKKKVVYGGGSGDSSKTISYADYLNLPEAEKTMGITYYIPDYPDTSIGNIKEVYIGTVTVSASAGKAVFTHNLNIEGNYTIDAVCTSNENLVHPYSPTANSVKLMITDTSFGFITGDRTISYTITKEKAISVDGNMPAIIKDEVVYAGGSASGDTTVRYDSDLDAVQVKNGEEWVNWKTVGLKYFDLNTFSEDDFTITSNGSGSYNLVSLNPFYCTSTSTKDGYNVYVKLENQLLPGYKYLNLVGSVRLYTTATATVYFINEKTGEVDYKWTSSQADQKDAGISQKIELPILEGYYTIQIGFSSWYGYGTSYIKFTTFTMTNE